MSNIRKLTVAVCLSTVVFASTAAKAEWQYNWLLGVSAGWNQNEGSGDGFITPPAPAAQTLFSGHDVSDSNFIGGVFAGYQARCNGWLLGVELNVDWQGNGDDNNFVFTDATGATWAGTASYKRDATVGLTGRMGFEISPYFMPYVRAGVETSDDDASFSMANNAVVPLVVSASDSSRSYRFVGGVGAEFPVPMLSGLSFRAEYNYHSRGKALDASAVASDNLTVAGVSVHPHANSVKASLVWNFL